MSLLTASESHAFQSFLSSIATTDSHSEWAIYPSSADSLDIPLGKEALAKATKDLMQLDTNRWPQNTSPIYEERALLPPPQSDYTYLNHSPFHLPSPPFHYLKHRHPNLHHAPRPPLPHHHHSSSYPSNHRHPPSIAIAPLHTLSHSADTPPLSSSSTSTVHSLAQPHMPSPSPSIPPIHPNRLSPPTSAKRPLPHDPSASSSSNKRSRSSPLLPPHSSASSTADGSYPTQNCVQRTASQPRTTGGKPTLLTPSQKKANHIQSEQKRRANIRRGYEKLCETVPSLRDAIREEEAGDGSYDDRSGNKGRGKRGRGRGDKDGEKVDGRAGPRSENVVLARSES